MRYAPSHEWAKLEGQIATIGISKRASQELGEVVHVELPELGQQVKAGSEVVVVESTKAATDLYSPLSGEVIEVNSALKIEPGKVNTSPENEGWLFKLKVSTQAEYDSLIEKSH